MKKLLKYFRGYTKECILGPLFKLFEATLELIVPLVVASIIDRGIGGGDGTYIIYMCLLLVLLGTVGLIFSVTAQYFAAKASVGFVTRTRLALFSHIQSLSYSDIDTLGTSGLITRMTTDSSRVQNGLNLALRLLLRSPFVVFGAMIMAFTIDASSGATFAVVIPLLSLVVFGIMLITMPLYKKVQSGVDRILEKTRENLFGARVIRAFGKEEDEIADYNSKNLALLESQKHVGRISALMNPFTYVIINIGIITLIYVGGVKVNVGNLTQGEVIALYNYMSQILVELVKLANLIISITRALASAYRIAAVFDITPSQSFGDVTRGGCDEFAVKFNGVSLKYAHAAENSIEDISFSVRHGETVGIIGGTGSGKTSVINLIPRFYDATDGEILLDGIPVSSYKREAILSRIGIVPQRSVLFSGSIRDNMLWGNEEASDTEIYEALKTAQATGIVEEHGGLDARIEAEGKNLSGGQRQRLAIARALVKKPEILILDDSLSALDYATDASLRTTLRQSSDGRTTFIVSQRAASVMHADKILVLDDGKLVGRGTHDELMRDCSVYREIYDSQLGGGLADEK